MWFEEPHETTDNTPYPYQNVSQKIYFIPGGVIEMPPQDAWKMLVWWFPADSLFNSSSASAKHWWEWALGPHAFTAAHQIGFLIGVLCAKLADIDRANAFLSIPMNKEH